MSSGIPAETTLRVATSRCRAARACKDAASAFHCSASCHPGIRWRRCRRRSTSTVAEVDKDDAKAPLASSVGQDGPAPHSANAGSLTLEDHLGAIMAKFALTELAPTAGTSSGVLPRVGVVATLRDVEGQVDEWVRWYELIGVSHMFLYFDDPERDATSIESVRSAYDSGFVSLELNNAELRAQWPKLGCWGQLGAFTEDRMCRQLFNIAHCLRRCWKATPGAPEAIDWLIHVDHDEIFLPPPQGLTQHFQHLTRSGCGLCLYQNYEAVPEDHTLQPFRDVSLFKVPSGRVPRTPAGQRSMEFWASRTEAGNYFLYYDNGKSAVRVRRRHDGGKPLAPTSVHLLADPGQVEELVHMRAAWSNFPQPELEEIGLPWLISRPEEVVSSAKVLHYPATHYERLFRKYDHLKEFPSVRFGGALIVPPSFHLEARDCYTKHTGNGQDVQKKELKLLMERSAFLSNRADVDQHLRAGTLVRVCAASTTLQAGCWLPPPSLSEAADARRQRVPSQEDILRMQQMPRCDAEVLLQEEGGLIRRRREALDDVVMHLEATGWAACNLGARPDVLRKALGEASQLEQHMSPGITVVQNQQADQSAPRARRGDKILWLQEHGLTDSSSGPAPNLVLLAGALEDIGMQLDERLQRSSLGLRITERCDAMLACYDGGGAVLDLW